MELKTFNFLWEQGIKKAAQDVYHDFFNSTQMAKDYNIKIDLSDEMSKKLYCEYDRIKTQVREKYFNAGENDKNKIDVHKICACITGALLNKKILSIETTKESSTIPFEFAYANYAIAFLASIYTMYLFVLSDFEKAGENECYNELEKRATFIFPTTNPGHDKYIEGRIKTLALNDIYKNDFDILMYADMLFWIEKFNIDDIRKVVNEKNNPKKQEE